MCEKQPNLDENGWACLSPSMSFILCRFSRGNDVAIKKRIFKRKKVLNEHVYLRVDVKRKWGKRRGIHYAYAHIPLFKCVQNVRDKNELMYVLVKQFVVRSFFSYCRYLWNENFFERKSDKYNEDMKANVLSTICAKYELLKVKLRVE